MFYVIQKNVFKEPNYDKIFETLDRLNLDYEIIDCLPFIEELEVKTERKDIFCFGSVKMSRLATKMNWYPGSFYGNNHDFNIYKNYYKENLLNYDSEIKKFSDIITWSHNEVKFIRPTKDSKVFTGKLFTKIKWDDFKENSLNNGHTTCLNGDTLIQVSSVKVIYKEARVWIIDGNIVTSSYYMFNGNVRYEETVEPEALNFAKSMIELFQVAEAFVMDICLGIDGWKIVEINCINCSGFYNGDLQKIIIALENKYNPIKIN
jgi:hypothetical protein